ncbi:zinc ribbon domain-containing protein [Thermogutta sp.]|jgi:putative FmdB family regulatory protein|uniref:FmdB family zinc ribbon protein n=1 Tax=Thermogutta sp. TaxID=1962930 RepID=UPI00321FAC25
MPTYEYVCDACEHTFEEFQSITAEPLRKCPACGKNKLRRVIGPGGAILFKGSGFYCTDYRSESYKKAASREKSNGDGSNGSGSGKSSAGKSGSKSGE